MSAKQKSNIPSDKLDLYDKLIKTNPKIERKDAANPYTSLNGHMFSYLDPSGSLALRLPEAAREDFLKKYKTKLFEAYGAVMKEYVTVPDKLLRNTKELQKYFELSHAYTKTLKPNHLRRGDHEGPDSTCYHRSLARRWNCRFAPNGSPMGQTPLVSFDER